MRVILLLFLTPLIALADGGFFASAPFNLSEYHQVAFVDWRADTGTEILCVLPGFRGHVKDFAWIIPVPALPTVRTAPVELFSELVDVTRTVYLRRKDDWNCGESRTVAGIPPPSGDVEILAEDLVGIFDVTVLAADRAASLADSLDSWGYLHDGYQSAVEPILADYVARAWVFVTLKVDSTAFAAAFPEHVPGEPWQGGVEPIELEFHTAAPVYPLRISALSTSREAKITVFACAAARLDFEGATTEYARHFDEIELGGLASQHPQLARRLRPGSFLTRLDRRMSAEDMNDDLLLTVGADQSEYIPVVYQRFSGSRDFLWFAIMVIAAWSAGRLRAVLGSRQAPCRPHTDTAGR